MTVGITLRDVDPLHGGQVDVLVPLYGAAMPSTAPAAIIRRGTTTNPFLGAQGWQAVEYAFVPREARGEDGRLVLRFGPDLVDNVLRHDDLLQIDLPELGISGVVAWQGITRSVSVDPSARSPGGTAPPVEVRPGGDGAPGPMPAARLDLDEAMLAREGLARFVTDGPLPPTAGIVIERMDGEPRHLGPDGWQTGEHVFAPEQSALGADRTRLCLGRSGLEAIPPGTPLMVRIPQTGASARVIWPGYPPAPPPPPPPRGWLWLVAVAVLLAAAVGGFVFWQAQRQPDPPVALPADPPVAAPPVSPDPVAPSPPADGQDAYASARAAQAEGDCETARRDMTRAAEAEFAQAFLALAEAQDSLDFEPCLAASANDIRALELFGRACTAGAEGAADALSRLVQSLEARAGSGDAVARDVMRLAVPDAVAACRN